MSSQINACKYLRAYVDQHWREMTPAQIRAALTTARQAGVDMSLSELSHILHETLTLPPSAPKPIYNVGAQMARYVLEMIGDKPHGER